MSEDRKPYGPRPVTLPGSMQHAYEQWIAGTPIFPETDVKAAFRAGWIARTGYPGPKVREEYFFINAREEPDGTE